MSDIDDARESDPPPTFVEADVERTEPAAQRARLTLEEEAEEARRRVLRGSRGRIGPASAIASSDADDDVELRERLRELVRGVEEETERLQDDVSRLRSAAGRAGATVREEIERAANELVDESAAGSLEALTGAVESLQETAGSLNTVAAGLLTSIEQLGAVSPVAEQLARLAAAPPSIPDALAGVLSDLTEQLSALSDVVSSELRSSMEGALTTEFERYEARMEHALARVVDELARIRRRLPVTKKGAPVDLSKDQLTAIGQSVGDYLLAAMREQNPGAPKA
jgi:predicted  nucleic acid-binding Zn-ribbon protein